MRNKIVSIARGELGYKEQGNNKTKFGEWYGMQDEWCNMFVCWCAAQAGIGEDIIPKAAYVPSTANWFDAKGQYKNSKANGGNYIPQAGDIVLFDYNHNTNSDHIGIVERVEGNTLYTIEGNKNNMVQRCTYDLESKDIRAYCVPAYKEESITQPTPVTVPQETVGKTKIFKKATKIYENSNLTGKSYDYKANTTVEILENLVDVDKVKSIVTGRVGYVYKKDLYKEESTYITKNVNAKTGLNVRNNPSLNATRVGGLANGTKVTVYEEKNGWSRIGNNQWVYSKYLK